MNTWSMTYYNYLENTEKERKEIRKSHLDYSDWRSEAASRVQDIKNTI